MEDISFLVTEINEHYDKSRKYSIYNFKLENMELIIDIDKLLNVQTSNSPETNSFRFRIVIKIYDYSCCSNFVNMGGSTVLFVKEFKTLEEAIKVLFSFRQEYKYSKLTDNFEEKEKINYIEKKVMVFNRLCDIESIDVCCVCYEPNILLTDKCKHCLCRLCFNKIEYLVEEEEDEERGKCLKSCPICRWSI